jgi:hypothetical protein
LLALGNACVDATQAFFAFWAFTGTAKAVSPFTIALPAEFRCPIPVLTRFLSRAGVHPDQVGWLSLENDIERADCVLVYV